MKCHIKPNIHFLPSLWSHMLFMSSFGEQRQGMGGKGGPTACWLVNWSSVHPRDLGHLSVQMQWQYNGFWTQSISKEDML